MIFKTMHKCRSYGPGKLNLWSFYYLTFKCDLDLQSTWINISDDTAMLLLMENTSAKLFTNPCTNVQGMDRTCSIYAHFIIWSSWVTLTFNLSQQRFQIALLVLKDNNCAKLFWNPCMNVHDQDQLHLSPFYDLPWPSTYVKKMFQMVLLFFKDNNCAIPFKNPCINVHGMARTSSIYDQFIIGPSSSTYLNKCFKSHFKFSKRITVPNHLQTHA